MSNSSISVNENTQEFLGKEEGEWVLLNTESKFLTFNTLFVPFGDRVLVYIEPMSEMDKERQKFFTDMGSLWSRSSFKVWKRSSIAESEAKRCRLKIIEENDIHKIVLNLIELFMETKTFPHDRDSFLSTVQYLTWTPISVYSVSYEKKFGYQMDLSRVKLWVAVNDLWQFVNMDRVRVLRHVWKALKIRIENLNKQ